MLTAAATGLFLVFVLFTAPLFSMVAFTPAGGGKGFIQQQVVDSDPSYPLLRQASAQEESTTPPSTLPFTPFSLQQQETVPEEEQEQQPTDEGDQSLTQEPPPTVTEGTAPPPSTTDDGQTTFQARPGQNVPLTPQPNEPTTRQDGGDQSAGSNTTTPSGSTQIKSETRRNELELRPLEFGTSVSSDVWCREGEALTGGGFVELRPAVTRLYSSFPVVGAGGYYNGWSTVGEKIEGGYFGGVSLITQAVCAKIITSENTVNSTTTTTPSSGSRYIETSVRTSTTSIPPNSQNSVGAYCQQGEALTGGGFSSSIESLYPEIGQEFLPDPHIRVYKNYPSGNGWAVEAKSNQSSPTRLDVYAVCAKIITSENTVNSTTTTTPSSGGEQIEINRRYVAYTTPGWDAVVRGGDPDVGHKNSLCQQGEVVTGGGFYSQSSDVIPMTSTNSGNSWYVKTTNDNPTEGRAVVVYAMCARVVSTAQQITPATVPPPTGNATGATTMTPSTNDTGTTTTTTTPATNDTGEVGGGGGFLILDNSTLTGEGLVGGATVAPEPGGIAPPLLEEGGQPTQEPGVPPPTVGGGGDTGRGPQGGVTVEDTERGPQGGVTVEEDSIKVVPVPTNGFVGDRYEVKSYLRNDIKTPIEGAPWYFCSNYVPGRGCNAEGITYEKCDTFSLDPDLAPTGYLPLYCFAVRYSTPGTYLVTAQSHDYQGKRIGGSAQITVREGLPGGATVAPEPGGVAPTNDTGGPPLPTIPEPGGVAPTNDTGGATETSATEPPLRVEAIANATQAVAPATIRFDANITGGAPPYSYTWSDPNLGLIDQDRSITLNFFEPGTFTYGLTVTDSRGKVVTDNVQIVISERGLPTEGIVAPEPGGIAPPPLEGGVSPGVPEGGEGEEPEGGVSPPSTTEEQGGEEPPAPPPSSDDTGEEGEGTPPSTTTEEEPTTPPEGGG